MMSQSRSDDVSQGGGRSASASERARLAYGWLQCDRHSTRVDFSPTSLETRAQREKSPARRSAPSALNITFRLIYLLLHRLLPTATTSRAFARALRHHPPPCRHSAGLILLLLTSLLHHRVSISSTYHVRLLHAQRTTFTCSRICATTCALSLVNHQYRPATPTSAKHRASTNSKCRGETAA